MNELSLDNGLMLPSERLNDMLTQFINNLINDALASIYSQSYHYGWPHRASPFLFLVNRAFKVLSPYIANSVPILLKRQNLSQRSRKTTGCVIFF